MNNPASQHLEQLPQPPLLLLPQVAAYLRDIVEIDSAGAENVLVSLVMFGSAANGSYSESVSDVDLLLIVRDEIGRAALRQLQKAVADLEIKHNLSKPQSHSAGLLEKFFDRLTANTRSFFICTRADLLSGDPGRILGIPAAQARFVDRIAISSIIGSGITMWGEDLLAQLSLPPIRRLDVGKAFFGLFNQLLFCAVCYPLLPTATKHAMNILKRSVHNCYFCCNLRPARLTEEIAFFRRQYQTSSALTQLLELRAKYRSSFRFVLTCFSALAQLHWRTALDNDFPRKIRVL